MDSWRGPSVPDLPGRGPEIKIADRAGGGLTVAAAGPAASLYACGITPYDATHIGHAATFIAWDLLVRAWRDAGHEVSYVQNVTDVDDPLLERADRDGEDWRELADREIALFRGDMEALRVLPPEHYVGAVEALPVIERLTGRLGEHGALYDLDGDVYLARSADPEFGTVTGLDSATMINLFAENGGDPGRPGKKDPLDPLVWLAARPGEPAWPSPLGRGRPGWHVECAAIATEYLGATFDIQAGGTDLAFPHHEMSASHARAAFGGAVGPTARSSRAGSRTRGWCGWTGRRCPSRGATSCSCPRCWRGAPTRWRSGSRSSLITTARTGTGPTPGWRPRRPASAAGGPPWWRRPSRGPGRPGLARPCRRAACSPRSGNGSPTISTPRAPWP